MKTSSFRLAPIPILLVSMGVLGGGCASSKQNVHRATTMKPLFDGQSLSAWQVRGGSAKYRVEDGMIIGQTAEGSPDTYLCTTRDYADFELELQVMCDVPLNSGIQIRGHVYEEDTPQASDPGRTRHAGEVYGYQCKIIRQSRGAAGNFLDEARYTKWLDNLADNAAAREAFKDAQWNHYRIVARGDHIRSWVNGVPCADFHDDTDAGGFIGLQVPGMAPGTGPHEVRWKNIYLRELKRGEEAP